MSVSCFAFDRRVTTAVALAVVVEAVGVVFWAGAAAQRIEQLEASVVEMRPLDARLTRIEAQLSAARGQLDRIQARLERQSSD